MRDFTISWILPGTTYITANTVEDAIKEFMNTPTDVLLGDSDYEIEIESVDAAGVENE